MAKRIKKVFTSSDQVIHLWANQSQNEARCRNVFFHGRSIYSYGHHYELGRIVEFEGKLVALINNSGYSVTTSKHISHAWHAVEHMPRLKVEGIGNGSIGEIIAKGLLRRQDQILDSLFGVFSQRRFYQGYDHDRSSEYSEAGMVSQFNTLCDILGFEGLKLDVDQDFIGLYNEHVKLMQDREKFLNSPEELAKKQAKAEKRNQDQIKSWRDGGATTNAVRNLKMQILRIIGESVQTSRGATVPLKHAKRLLRMIERNTAKKGESVGGFKLTSIENDVVRIGCHTISLLEAKNVLNSNMSLANAA